MNHRFGPHQVPEVAPVEALERMGRGALLIDVREGPEWADGHALGARHIPLGQLAAETGALSPDQELLLICQSGRRSADAVRTLTQAGFTRVASVAGGTTEWQHQGLPVTGA